LDLKSAFKKFKKDYWGVVSLIYILFIIIVAIFAYSISPDSSKNANQINLSIHSKPPGFSILILHIPNINSFNFDKSLNLKREIMIKDYKIFNDTLMFKEFGTLYQKYKKISINDILIKNNKNEFEAEFIKENFFFLGTRQIR